MIKIVTISLICAFLIMYLKSINSEFFSLALLGSGIIICYMGIDYLVNTVDFINKLISYTGLQNDIIQLIFKITGIGVIVNFGASTIEDMGYKGLSEKLAFIGRISILVVSLPIFESLINLILKMIT